MDIYSVLEGFVYVGLPVLLFVAIKFDDARKSCVQGNA